MNNLEATLQELQAVQTIIHDAIDRLRNVLGGRIGKVTLRGVYSGRKVATTVTGQKRHLTAAAKRKISAKMKAKWAARKAALAAGKKPELVSKKKAA